MPRILLALCAVAALALPGVPAHADPVDETVLSGGCGGAFQHDDTGFALGGQDANLGAVVGTVVLTDPDAPSTPVGGWLTCSILVNGVWQGATTPVHGVTVVATQWTPIQITASPTDVIKICTHVAFDLGNVYDQCVLAGTPPPQPFAFCPLNQLSATRAYTSAPPNVTPATVSWTLSLSMACPGTAPAAGSYSLTLSGTDTEGCATAGTGTATISGTGPNGAVSGSVSYSMHPYGFLSQNGTITDASGTYSITLVLYGTNVSLPLCPVPASSTMGGTGWVL